MAADKHKDRPDLSGIVDEGAWDDAIDEWEQALQIPEEPAPPESAVPASLPAPEAVSPSEQDPLVELMSGEMELPENGGEALGSLLGSSFPDEPTPARSRRPASEPPPPASSVRRKRPTWDDGPTPISLEPSRPPSRPMDPLRAATPGAAPAPAAVSGGASPRPPAPPAPQLRPPRITGPILPADLDLDSLLEGLGSETAPEPKPPPPPAPFFRDIIDEPAATTPTPPPELPPELPLEPLDIFAELAAAHGADAAEEPLIMKDAEAVAGEVLPAPEPPAGRPRGPLELPVELEQAAGEPEPSLEAVPVPATLLEVDLGAFSAPEQGTPVSPPRAYWEALVGMMESEARTTDSSGRAAAMELTAARACEELGAVEEALAHYREALGHRPDYVPAMRELRRLYSGKGDIDQTSELLGAMAERVGPEERRALLFTRAELLWSRAGDDSGAAAVLEPEVGPGHPDHLRGLLLRADLACAGRDDDELEESLTNLAVALLGDGPTRAAVELELGRLKEARGRASEAAAAYRRALAAEPAGAAREGLLRLATAGQDPAALAEALTATDGLVGTWGARRFRRRARLVQHHRTSGDPLGDLEQARRLAPGDVLVAEDLAAARAASGDLAGAVEVLLGLARSPGDSVQRALLLVEAAQLAEHGLQDPARALELYGEAIDLAPELAVPAARRTETLLRSSDPQLRLEALRSGASTLRGSRRAAQHLAAADLLEKELHRPEEAAQELVACLEHEPGCRPALQMLERLYRQGGQLERLAAALDTAAEAADAPGQAVELRERAIHLYEGPLGRPEVALRRYRELGQLAPDRPFVRRGVARLLAALRHHEDLAQELSEQASSAGERVAARTWIDCGDAWLAAGRGEEARAAFGVAAAKRPAQESCWRLVMWGASQGSWREVADAWSALAEVMPAGSGELRALHMRLAGLGEHELGDPAEAARAYRAALTGGPAAPGAAEGLRRCLRRTRSFDQMLEDVQREIEERPAGERFALLMLAGELARRAGAEWRQAEAYFRRALEEARPGAPAPEQARRRSLARASLEHLLAEHEAWQPLADLLIADLNEAAEGEPRIRAYRSLAELDLRRGDEDSARLSVESVLELDPGHLPSLRFLRRRLLAGGDLPGTWGALRREAEAATQPADAASIWLELARSMAVKPEGSARGSGDSSPLAAAARDLDARAALLRGLEADPRRILILRCLLDQAFARNDRADLARFYELLARAVPRGTDAAIFLTRAGELSADDQTSIRLFREALERTPELLGAIYNLRQVALRTGDWASAALACEGEGRASHVREHVAAAYLLAGEIARRQLAEPERAVANFHAVLQVHPADPDAFKALREHAEAAGNWEELAELLTVRTQVERSRVELVELHRALAVVCKEHLRDRARAKQELREVLALRPEDPAALGALADMHAEDEEWPKTVECLIRLARQQKDPLVLRDIFLRLGRIYHEKLPDPKRALVSLNRVISLDASNLEALGRLSDLYLQSQDYKRALATTQQLFEKETDAHHKVVQMLRMAQIHEEGLKDVHQAAICYRRAQEIAPHDLKTIGEMCGFFARHGDQRSLMVHLDRSVATMRARLKHDAFDFFAFHALFKIFGWRRTPDACLCAAQVLEALGEANAEEQEFIDTHVGGVGAPGSALGEPEHDEWLFQRSVPGGFRQVFLMLDDAFTRVFGGSLKPHGLTRADRVTSADHPLRRVGDALARDFKVGSYEIYLSSASPGLLLVENTDPPAILLGKGLLEEVTDEEIAFIMGRCLWVIRKAMILPTRFRPEDLELVVAAVVRQYAPDFKPVGVGEKELNETTRQIGRAIPKKIRNELTPFALECSGPTVNLREIGAAVVHSANRAGLLACRSVHAALSVLRKASGQPARRPPEHRLEGLRGNQEAEELLAFAVSDAHFELRRAMQIAIGK